MAHIVTDEDGSLKIKQIEDSLTGSDKAHLEFSQAVVMAISNKP